MRVALQEAFVGVALHGGAHRRPVFGVDQVDDHAPQLGRVLELVLRLAEDQRQRARLPAQLFQRVAVVVEQRIAILGQQRGPGVDGGDGAGLVVGRAAALVRHLEEQQVGELLDVVAIAHAVVAQDVAVVPELLN